MTIPELPERISRLGELANNLWWSWHEEARQLFRALDYSLWRFSVHNPVRLLNEANPNTLKAAATDPSFLALYDSVMAQFDNDMSACNCWFTTSSNCVLSGPVAYFSMEFAIHNSLPIYAGGLGVLAGDICKEASDIGLPTVAVGFMYPQGYFHQSISTDGWQEETHRQLDFDKAPISRVVSPTTGTAIAEVSLGDVTLALGVWQVRVGCTSIYLLDTNLGQNPEQYQQLSARLYVADHDQRLQQEIVLGIGGVRVLRALNINPAVWHANEGHTAFMMLERIREEVAQGASFTEALARVQATTVFTTHTPVMAGHDIFPTSTIEKNFNGYWKSLGIDRDTFLQLGAEDSSVTPTFNMTASALRMASQRCAVSQLHEEVTRRMWHRLWPESPEDKVPISHVTNGIHVPSWVAPEMCQIFDQYLGKYWREEHDRAETWRRVADIPDETLWTVRQTLRRKLLHIILERAQEHWASGGVTAEQVMAMGALLDHDTLTIGFVRRFTEYKRPSLILSDIERLQHVINNQLRPIQIIFAGKSHPADFLSKQLLHQVYILAKDRKFQGRIAFVEDYDMHMARYLVQGVDVWLNTPRRLQEASGTSGMKAALNGVLHLSVLDGWWHEGYNGTNGWVIGDSLSTSTPEEEDKKDADSIYQLLEQEIVPLYYQRDRDRIPHGWIRMVKEAIRSIVPVFCSRRMLKEYTERMYQPAIRP